MVVEFGKKIIKWQNEGKYYRKKYMGVNEGWGGGGGGGVGERQVMERRKERKGSKIGEGGGGEGGEST